MRQRSPTNLVPIAPQDVRLGLPTHLDIYRASGQMFLVRGTAVERSDTLARLHAEGFKLAHPGYSNAALQKPVNQHIVDIANKLLLFERDLQAGRPLGAISLKFRAMAQDVIRCCDEDADAALARLYLDYHYPYSVLHHLLVAVVISVLTRTLGWIGSTRMSLVAAALTHDLGALPLRHAVDACATMNEEQAQKMQQHPNASMQLLAHHGVNDAVWLQAVREHHECIDGSGYPCGIAVAPDSGPSLMAVADSFASMLRPRPYRERKLGPSILQDLRQHQHTRYAPAPIDAIATHIGDYHAGSIVRLVNGDMAVVTHHRPRQPQTPAMLVLADHRNQPYDTPYAVDSGRADFAIVTALEPELCRRFHTKVCQSWAAPPAAPDFSYAR